MWQFVAKRVPENHKLYQANARGARVKGEHMCVHCPDMNALHQGDM